MKKATLEATDENILQSIKEQKGTERNTEIMEFIKALDLIEENIFISLDARWGEGKTFYVRQIEKTLEYQTLKNFETDDNKNKYEEMKPYFEKTVLEDIELGNSYLPVYYNAWLYDNHSDPLMSLLYVIIKKCGLWIDSKLVKDKTDKLKDIIKSIQVNLGIFSINGDKVIDAVSEKNIFDGIQLAEDIRQRVKEIFNQVIEGQTQKLVIFIDELDRCKPKDMGKYQGKISGMSLEYFADLTGISSKTCNRYNIILEKNHLLFVYRSNDKMKNFDGTMRQINNCYSRYCDKELCIAYATDYENRYGYEHKIVQTRKNKEEADKNRRLAAIYNRICEGHEYPIEVVREVQKYIRNKNQYLQKLIDEKKAQSYMAFSEKEWVARLESQLRDESVFLQAKLESDCEFESNIWGEPNPLDIFIEEAV